MRFTSAKILKYLGAPCTPATYAATLSWSLLQISLIDVHILLYILICIYIVNKLIGSSARMIVVVTSNKKYITVQQPLLLGLVTYSTTLLLILYV